MSRHFHPCIKFYDTVEELYHVTFQDEDEEDKPDLSAFSPTGCWAVPDLEEGVLHIYVPRATDALPAASAIGWGLSAFLMGTDGQLDQDDAAAVAAETFVVLAKRTSTYAN